MLTFLPPLPLCISVPYVASSPLCFFFFPHNFPSNFWSTCCSGTMNTFCLIFLHNTVLPVIQTEQEKVDESRVLVRCPKWLTWQGQKNDRCDFLFWRSFEVFFMKHDIMHPLLPLLIFPSIQYFNLFFIQKIFPVVNVSWKLMFHYLLSCTLGDFLRRGPLAPPARTPRSVLSPELHLLPF